MGPPVSIVTCQSYDEERVLEALRQSIRLIGGIEAFVKRGDRVLLKPNLLMGKSPGKAVTTHPSIVKGVLRIVHEAGGIPFIGDSPGIGSAAKAAGKAGIRTVADAMDCPVIEFDRPVLAPAGKGKVFKRIEIDRAVLDADVIINLPKWKTHVQMLLTLGVKNVFGCIPGARKALWHLKAGEDRRLFAEMLLDVYQVVQPSLTVLDGIVGMEGDGPSSGRPISLGLILASRDALSLDQIVCDLLNLPRRSLMTNRAAHEQGLGKDPIEVVGERVDHVRIPEFRFPKLLGADWNLPGFLRKILKNGIASRPVLQKEMCKACHHCVEICPPGALRPKGEELVFDYDQCIRCFCCQEICPEGAISIKTGWALKFVSRK